VGTRALLHGFPDIERFFGEWADERMTLTYIMKFGTLNFAPTQIVHPPLYHYLTFIPIGIFFVIGKLLGLFSDRIDFIRFYFNNTHYFFLIGRAMSYIFYWLSALFIFKICRLFYEKNISHITTFAFLLIPRFIADFSTTRPETLLFLNSSIFLYLLLRYYLDDRNEKFLYLSALFLGVSTATKYNALFLGFVFVPLLIEQWRKQRPDIRGLITKTFKIGLFTFLGFFICNPFFIIKFTTYFYNLYIFDTVWINYVYKGYSPSLFIITRIKDLISTLYLNLFGFIVLILGFWNLVRKDKRMAFSFLAIFLLFEIYFSLLHKSCSPTYYLNPLIAMAALIFASGVDFLLNKRRQFVLILIMFFVISFFNYYVHLRDLSARPTYLQEARAFIEKNISEFSNICIASDNNLPQLNMTRASYNHLIQTFPGVVSKDKDIDISFRPMDSDENYDSIFRELRIQSLMKKPQYNLIRWDKKISSEEEAVLFLRKHNIKYIMANGEVSVGSKKLKDLKIVTLVREYSPNNTRVYEDNNFYLYKVNPLD